MNNSIYKRESIEIWLDLIKAEISTPSGYELLIFLKKNTYAIFLDNRLMNVIFAKYGMSKLERTMG